MKRYKGKTLNLIPICKTIKTEKVGDKHKWVEVEYFIPAGTEIVLEEVETEAVDHECNLDLCVVCQDRFNKVFNKMVDICKTNPQLNEEGKKKVQEAREFFDQPKEEKHPMDVCLHTNRKKPAPMCLYEACLTCGKTIKDQPLTPKDVDVDSLLTAKEVGLRRGQAYENFVSWWGKAENRMKNGNYAEIFYLEDKEFDRLYQTFLSEYKK